VSISTRINGQYSTGKYNGNCLQFQIFLYHVVPCCKHATKTAHYKWSYTKRQNNQLLYCWLQNNDYGNSGKQAYTYITNHLTNSLIMNTVQFQSIHRSWVTGIPDVLKYRCCHRSQRGPDKRSELWHPARYGNSSLNLSILQVNSSFWLQQHTPTVYFMPNWPKQH
jgi:hypothetical protein